jgi:beta-phosphoglucomutase-like phosphatase (HAD superfamily)
MFVPGSHVKALIFDCDGTLADTMPLHYLAWQEALREINGRFSEKLFYQLAGAPNDKILTYLNETLGCNLNIEEVSQAKDEYFRLYLPQARPIEPVVAIARQYKGRLPMAVATGGILSHIQITLQGIGLANFFDAIVTVEEVARPKPAPDTFLEAARRLGVAPQYCHVFEDGDLGIEGARHAGMTVTDVRDEFALSSQLLQIG